MKNIAKYTVLVAFVMLVAPVTNSWADDPIGTCQYKNKDGKELWAWNKTEAECTKLAEKVSGSVIKWTKNPKASVNNVNSDGDKSDLSFKVLE